MKSGREKPIAMGGLRTALFEFKTIFEFLSFLIEIQGRARGIRSRFAEAAGCQPSYLTQVLAGTANLSHEQLFGIARLLELDDVEWDYVRELGLLERAGNDLLRDDCRKRLMRIRATARSNLPAKLEPSIEESGRMSGDFLLWYVSSWQVSAILAAVILPKFRSEAALAKGLEIPLERMKELIRQSLERGMLKRDERGHLVSNLPSVFYLGSDAAGQVFRSGWSQHGLARSHGGYRDGFQKGGVFRASRAEFAALKERVQGIHRDFFSTARDPEACEMVGFFGIDLFEA